MNDSVYRARATYESIRLNGDSDRSSCETPCRGPARSVPGLAEQTLPDDRRHVSAVDTDRTPAPDLHGSTEYASTLAAHTDPYTALRAQWNDNDFPRPQRNHDPRVPNVRARHQRYAPTLPTDPAPPAIGLRFLAPLCRLRLPSRARFSTIPGLTTVRRVSCDLAVGRGGRPLCSIRRQILGYSKRAHHVCAL